MCFLEYSKPLDCIDHEKPWFTLKEMGMPQRHACVIDREPWTGQTVGRYNGFL